MTYAPRLRLNVRRNPTQGAYNRLPGRGIPRAIPLHWKSHLEQPSVQDVAWVNSGRTFPYANVVMFQKGEYVIECPFFLCGGYVVPFYSNALSGECDTLQWR